MMTNSGEKAREADAQWRRDRERPDLRDTINRRGLRLCIEDASTPYKAIDPEGHLFRLEDDMRLQLRFMVSEDPRRYLYNAERYPHLLYVETFA